MKPVDRQVGTAVVVLQGVAAAKVVVGKVDVGVVVGAGVVVLQTQQTSLVHIPSGHFVSPNALPKDGAQPSPSGH